MKSSTLLFASLVRYFVVASFFGHLVSLETPSYQERLDFVLLHTCVLVFFPRRFKSPDGC